MHLPWRPIAWVERDALGWERQELGDCSEEQEDVPGQPPKGLTSPPQTRWVEQTFLQLRVSLSCLETRTCPTNTQWTSKKITYKTFFVLH